MILLEKGNAENDDWEILLIAHLTWINYQK